MKKIWITTLLVVWTSTASTFAQGPRNHKGIGPGHEAVKAYIETNVIPVMSVQRATLDTYLTADEQQILAETRDFIKMQRAERKEKMEAFREKRKEGGVQSFEGERPRPTDAQIAEMRAKRTEMRKLMTKANTVLDAHETEIYDLLDEVKDQAETWRADIRNMVQENRPEREGGERIKRERGPKGEHFQGRSRRGGYTRSGAGPMFARGRGGIHGLNQPLGFLLWDGSNFGESSLLEEDMLSVFPNPTTQSNTLKFDLKQTGNVKVELLNSSGEVIRTFLNENRNAGQIELKMDLSDLENGMYFYRISSPNGVETQKLIKE